MSESPVKGIPLREAETRLGELFQYEFNQVQFASRSDIHRAKIISANNGAQLWVENKKTKQQWQAIITNVSECGPAGVPSEAVLTFLKKAFELISIGREAVEATKDDPSVDFLLEGGEVLLVLTLSMYGVWRPKFTFTLLPVGLDKIDVLEAKLRDAQEEIVALKKALSSEHDKEVVFMSLSTSLACGFGGPVQWNVQNDFNAAYFSLNPDETAVTVRMEGTYVIQIRVGQINNSNGHSMILLRNGTDIAHCFQSDGHGYHNTAQIYEIVRLAAGDTLLVKCHANNGLITNQLTNRFTVHRIGK